MSDSENGDIFRIDYRGLELRVNEQVKAARDALEKRCELQLETIRELRGRVEFLEELRTNANGWNTTLLAEQNKMREENEHLKQVTSEHAREVNRLTVENELQSTALVEAQNTFDNLTAERDELRAELTRTQNQLTSWRSGNELNAELKNSPALQFKELVKFNKDLGDSLAHAVEVKNRCVQTINKLCSQVVELQAQLKGKE